MEKQIENKQITSQQAINFIETELKKGSNIFEDYFSKNPKIDKTQLSKIVNYIIKSQDQNAYFHLVRANAKFVYLANKFKMEVALNENFLINNILANPNVLYSSLFDSKKIKNIFENWNNYTFVSISPELESVFGDAYHIKKEKEKQAKQLAKSSTNGLSVSSYEKSTNKNSNTNYVQRGGAITTSPIYGGKNKSL